MNPPIEILCSANRPYARLLLIMVKSLIASANRETRYRIHLIDRGIPLHLIPLLESYAESQTIESLHRINGDDLSTNELPELPPFFSELPVDGGHYDRLLAPYLIEGPRAIYLDSDLLLKTDLAELWQTDLDSHSFGVVRDQNIPVISKPAGIVDWKERGLDPDTPYFNSGVMLMNLNRWRSEEVTPWCIDCGLRFMADFDRHPPLHDQYTLNVYGLKGWAALDQRWNTFADLIQDDPHQFRIIHFAGAHKPFHPTNSSNGPSRFFIREAHELIKSDLDAASKIAASLERQSGLHAQRRIDLAPLRTPNQQVVPLASASSLATPSDEGEVAVVIPVKMDGRAPLRLANLEFLLRQYHASNLRILLIEQVAPSDGIGLQQHLNDPLPPSVHHLRWENSDPRIHKSALINHASRIAFQEMGVRYVWQIDADIFVNPNAVAQQLSALNSETIPVVFPFLYFVRLPDAASEDLRSLPTEEVARFDPSGCHANHYQIIDFFGPGSIIFSRAAFEATGGLDEAFTGWGWEDMEFSARLREFGQPHTLPLIGLHLHHEEDRAPRLDNFIRYWEASHPDESDETRERNLVHTIFHSFLQKFCLLSFGSTQRIALLTALLSRSADIRIYEGPLDSSALPAKRELANGFESQAIYSAVSGDRRHSGFQLDLTSSKAAKLFEQVFPERFLEFLVSAGYQILIEPPSEEASASARATYHGMKALLEKAFQHNQRSLSAGVLEFSDSPNAASLNDVLSHLHLPSSTGDSKNPAADLTMTSPPR